MTDTPRSQLERAYRLIQEERLDEALAILKPFTAKNPDNVDGWWLLANAVSEPDEARHALDQVLRLKPAHSEARDLLEKLEQEFPSYAPVSTTHDDLNDFFGHTASGPLEEDPFGGREPFDTDRVPSFIDQPPAKPDLKAKVKSKPSSKPRDFTDGADVDLPDFDATPEEPDLVAERRANRRPNPILVGLVALLLIGILAGGAALVILRNQGTTPTAVAQNETPTTSSGTVISTPSATTAATNAAISSTPEATLPATSAVIATSAVTPEVTAEASETSPATSAALSSTPAATLPATSAGIGSGLDATVQLVADKFKAGGNADAEARLDTSAAGKTLFVKFCSKAGPDLTKAVNNARELLATTSASARADLQAIGLEVVNCAKTTQTLYKATATMADAAAFADKTLDAKKFRSSWKNS